MSRPPSLKNPERVAAFFLLSITFSTIVFFRFFYLGADLGDSSLFQNIALQSSFPGYVNEFLKSIQVLIRRFVGISDHVSIFNFPNANDLDGRLFGAHAYLNFPAIQFFIHFLGYRVFISLVAATIMILPLFVGVLLISQSGSTKIFRSNCPTLLLLACYPGLLWSGMGQFYPDRLFFIFFPLFLLILDRLSSNPGLKAFPVFILLFVISATTTERASLYVALVCSFYFVTADFHRPLFLFAAITSFSWSVSYYAFFSTDVYTSSFFDSLKSFNSLSILLFSIPTLKLIVLHLPGIILVRKMRDLQLMLIAAMVPNAFGNIGGAEKIGWVTHYMTYLAATYIGIILVNIQRELRMSLARNVDGEAPKTIKLNSRKDKIVIAFSSFLLFVCINPNSRVEIIEISPLRHSGIIGATLNWLAQPQKTFNYELYSKEVDRINHLVPSNSKIGVSEETAKYVAENFINTYMFPVNMDQLDFVILRSASGVDGYRQSTIVNYANPEVGVKLTKQVEQLLLGKCFEVMTTNSSSDLYVFKRLWKYPFDEQCLARD